MFDNNGERENGKSSVKAEGEFTARLLRSCANLADRGVFIPRRHNFDLSKVSSIGVGGTAEAAFYPDTLAGLTELIVELKKANIPFALLGTAANVLIPDKCEELRGAVIFTRQLRSLAVDGENVFVFCGVTGAEFLQRTLAAGLTGAEFLEGIPCSIGGATYMNAGANGRHVSDILESVLAFGKGEMRVYSQRECRFSYKDSAFMHSGETILGVTFRLKKSTREAVEENLRLSREKRAALPKGRSLGCIFKNPPPLGKDERRISAGLLIEKAGMKGVNIGGARVSRQHGNFIINEGGATYRDVCELIDKIRIRVYETQGVLLQEEIRYLKDLWQ